MEWAKACLFFSPSIWYPSMLWSPAPLKGADKFFFHLVSFGRVGIQSADC